MNAHTMPVGPEKLLLIGGMSLMQVAETICDYEDATMGIDRNAYKVALAAQAIDREEKATIPAKAA